MGHAARLVLVVVAATRIARAEDVELRAAFELGLHAPRSLALDAWFVLNARLRLGITTSRAARRKLGTGRGLCLSRCTDRLTESRPDADPYRFAGVAAEAQLALGSGVTGRAALDTTRLAPTAAALELGLDATRRYGTTTLTLSPILRIGLARRDLDDNRDDGVLVFELAQPLWPGGGLLGIARGEVALQALRSTPSFGAALGAWTAIGCAELSIRVGAAEVVREAARSSLFAEIAIAWRH